MRRSERLSMGSGRPTRPPEANDMGLLEKLRPQPKWKHADASVRLEGLHEIDDTDQETLTALATDDPDPRVRRAAIARVTHAGAIAAIVRNDTDEAARDAAIARIASLAESGEESAALGAVNALAALGRQRELGAVARATVNSTVRKTAVEHISEQKILGGVA